MKQCQRPGMLGEGKIFDEDDLYEAEVPNHTDDRRTIDGMDPGIESFVCCCYM